MFGIPITALGFLGLPLAELDRLMSPPPAGSGSGWRRWPWHARSARASAVLLAGVAGASLLIAMPLAAI